MSSQEPNTGISRRDMMIKTVGVVGGTAAVGAGAERLDVSPVGEARAIAPLIVLGAGAAVAGGAAIGYLANEAADKYLGDERDYSGYTGADALHDEIIAGAVEMKLANEQVMTSISNNVTNSENVALAKGKAAIIEKMNAGSTESEATTAMQNAIDGYYATIEENIISHWNTQISQIDHMMTQVQNHSNLVLGDVFANNYSSTSSALSGYSISTFTYTLLDGTNMEYLALEYDYNSATYSDDLDMLNQSSVKDGGSYSIGVFPSTNSEGTPIMHVTDFSDQTPNPSESGGPYNQMIWKRDDVNAQLSGFVTDVYNAYEPGEIPTEDLVDPITAATELSQNYDGYQIQGAQAAMLGIPTSASQAVDIEVRPNEDDSERITVDIFTDHQVTDANGNVVGFSAGNTYEPSTWSEPLYIAYEYTEEVNGEVQTTSDFVQLEEPFFIHDIVEADGSSVESFTTESRNNQTADVATLQEELNQIQEAQLALQDEAQGSTGGGGFLSNVGRDGKIALAGAGVLALLGLSNR